MKTLCGLLLLCFVSFIITKETPYWSEWKPLSICTAKPCNCHPKKKDDECDMGKEVQVRFCFRGKNDTGPCPYDNNIGPIRLIDCTNDNRNCPFWSEWADFGTCYDIDGLPATQRERKCLHQHDGLKCYNKTTTELDGDVEYEIEADDCFAAITTTAAPTTTTTIPTSTIPPECQDQDGGDYDYGDSDEETTKPPYCDDIYIY